MNRRRYVAAAAALMVSAFAGTSANAATVVVPMGTADTVVDLADLAVSGLPVGGVSIGSVRSFASTDTNAKYNPIGKGKPFAIAKISLPDGSDLAVRSDGDTGSKGKTVPVAGIGDVTIGDLTATAGGDAAQSLVNAVDGQLRSVVAGLKARAAGVNAKVASDGSSTTNGAVVENVAVGLTDILPADLLAQLPLDKLIALADGLGIPLDLGALNGALDQVRAIAAAVDSAADASGRIEDAKAEIAALRAMGNSGVSDAQAGVDSAQAAVNGANATLSGLNAEHSSLVSQYAAQGCTVAPMLPGCPALAASIATVEGQISSQEAVVAARQATLTEAQAGLAAAQKAANEVDKAIDELQRTIDELVVTLNAVLDDILNMVNLVINLDLDGLLQAVLDGLQGMQLVSIDRMSFGVSTVASATSSKAVTVCEISGVKVLGKDRAIKDCAEVNTALDQVESTLKGVLALLPIKGVVPANLVTVDGPRMSTSPDGYAAEGYRIASAKVSGLDLTVQSVTLTQVVDGLVANARMLVSGALDTVEELTGVEVPVDVDNALNTLLDALNGLPIGDTLAGVVTPKVAISAIDLGSRSTFRAAGSGSDGVGFPDGNLPHTGGGVGSALLLLAVGGAMWVAIKPRTVRIGA